MTVCGIKHADGVCVMGECPYIKKCCPAVWDKSGEIEQTNEEWFCGLSTEEKAEWLSKHLHCGDCDIENRVCAGTYSGCKETLIKWLKEKHE